MAAPRRGRSSATRRSRPGRRPRSRRPRGRRRSRASRIHEFHLSTNYRNSAEIYDFAAAYAERVGLDADLPNAVRVDRRGPVELTGVADLEAATREAVVDMAGQVPGTVGIVVPVGPPLGGQRLAGVVAGARRRRARAPAPAVDSSVAPSGDDRVVVLTGLDTKGLEFDGIVVVRPEEIEAESVTGAARRCTSYSPVRPSC